MQNSNVIFYLRVLQRWFDVMVKISRRSTRKKFSLNVYRPTSLVDHVDENENLAE